MLVDQDVIQIGNISLVFHDSHSVAGPEMTKEEKFLSLVVILPNEKKYDDTVTIRAEVEAVEESGFARADQIEDINVG
jgi:hypothetical protein